MKPLSQKNCFIVCRRKKQEGQPSINRLSKEKMDCKKENHIPCHKEEKECCEKKCEEECCDKKYEEECDKKEDKCDKKPEKPCRPFGRLY